MYNLIKDLINQKNWILAIYFVQPKVRRDPKTHNHSIKVIDQIDEPHLTTTELSFHRQTQFL